MNGAIIIFILLVLVPLLSLVVRESDHDDRDRRGWWPGVKTH